MSQDYSTNLETYWLTRVYETNGTSFTFFHAVHALSWEDAVSLTSKGDPVNLQKLDDRVTWTELADDGMVKECRLWRQQDRPPCKTQGRFSVRDERIMKALPLHLNFGPDSPVEPRTFPKRRKGEPRKIR